MLIRYRSAVSLVARAGKTRTSNDSDLSMETLVQDTISVMERVLPPVPASDNGISAADKPQTVLVGHRCVR